MFSQSKISKMYPEKFQRERQGTENPKSIILNVAHDRNSVT